MALGALAGLGATFLMQAMLQASGKLLPDAQPPIKQDPGEFMIDQLTGLLPEGTQVPPTVSSAAARSMHLGYGMTPGVLYGAIRSRGGSPIIDGTLLGVGIWAAGYLGWLPATGLMAPLSEQRPEQIALPVIEHAIFGIALAAAFEGLMLGRGEPYSTFD